jgi:oligoendopeptidase F
MPTNVPARSAVPSEFTWNAESVFPDRAAWDAEREAISAAIPTISALTGTLTHAAALVTAFDTLLPLQRRASTLVFYAAMARECDANDSQAVAMTSQAMTVFSQFRAAVSFFEPALIACGEATVSGWIASEPLLAPYAHYVHDLFRRAAHVRSAEVEEVLGMASDPLSAIDEVASALTNADLRFVPASGIEGKVIDITQGNIHRLYSDPDRELRRTGWERYSDGYLQHQNTLAANLSLSMKRDVFFARVRKHDTALGASLHASNVPSAVFHNLITTFRANLPTWHRYWAARRRALGVDTLHPYDVWAPLTARPPVVPYKQAVEWIAAAMQPLGADYAETLKRGCLKDRWVDVYPNQGKRQGAFSYGVQGTHPFIMMSYNDTLSDMSTLAHELGHSMHSYLTWQTQPYIYSEYTLFAAEVASNFNQAMTRAYLMREKADDRDFQIALLEEAMYNFHRYFFQMPLLAQFELDMHTRLENGEGVTAQDMTTAMADLLAEGYGGEMVMDGVDRMRVGITWAKFGHLYANYYVFQYATGISAAHALSNAILAGGKAGAEAAARYRAFLSAGGAGYPVDALRAAGVDMTTPTAVETTFAIMAGYVERLEALTA